MISALHHLWTRIPRWAVWTTAVLLLLFVAAYVAIGWYLSSQLLQPGKQTVEYDHKVIDVSASAVTLQGGSYDVDGRVGLISAKGDFLGMLDAPTDSNSAEERATRSFIGKPPKALAAGDTVSVQGNIWTSNPEYALGMPYKDVRYKGPLGTMQSWEITDGKRTTWTIAVHGNGAPRSELLRFVEPVIASGNAMLIINYRNDSDAPRSPDGYSHLGDTEWQDVQAAVAYAKSQGATKINLYGVSLGGSLVQNYLRQAPSSETAIVDKVILDSPALDWKAVLRHRIDQKGLPTILAGPGFRIATLRSGIDFDRISTMPGSITRPTLIIHSSDDDNVPNPPSKAVAAAQPDLVQLLDLQHGGHVRTWNFNPVRYEQAVRDFLGNDK